VGRRIEKPDPYQNTVECQDSNGNNTKGSTKGRNNKSPQLRANNRGRIEYVTMDLTEATNRHPVAYAADWLYRSA
jgi:predicted O-linked N-acetylglucosamine transferase (SPINDLY family)